VEKQGEEEVFVMVEENASFPGGEKAMFKYISDNLQYPRLAIEKGIQGRVYVTFIVEKDGSITDIKVLRDIGDGCGDEVVRLVKTMPKWKPAKQRGKTVRQQFNLPVMFSLVKNNN
ncbi:MAG: energy transducer TonB, partial [Bacteroidales bacterium]|nr:energy transducer TonB [Bacteroidales bacterium]